MKVFEIIENKKNIKLDKNIMQDEKPSRIKSTLNKVKPMFLSPNRTGIESKNCTVKKNFAMPLM